MSTFSGSAFRVIPSSDRYPSVDFDGDGPPSYSAECLFFSKTAKDNMLEEVAVVTPKRVLGTRQFNFHFDVGTSYSLNVPGNDNARVTYKAALTKMSCSINPKRHDEFICQCEWIITGDYTP